MKITIRRARESDASEIADTFLSARARMRYLPRLHTDAEIRHWIEHTMLTCHEVWVAESAENGPILGFAALHDNWLGHLYIKPKAQRQGIGTHLLNTAKNSHPEGLRLYIFQRNTGARRFYVRHGFSVTNFTDGSENQESEPDCVYIWPGFPAAVAADMQPQ
ncbi:GNAT family N-acetyltransferase [Rhizohabitans arisaemae]|uniref:GNAT family N-acetyltransferase n=1 Tax=Rhizohabitans arisaemae TaxID=2720610 RepID=UPI0024B1062C|nr:GNAT family N-acetyltransferase [Rhizohabitans arisaemae]